MRFQIVAALIFIPLLHFIPLVSAASNSCEEAFQATLQFETDTNFNQRSTMWRARLDQSQRAEDPAEYAKTLNEISNYAAMLVRQKRNSEFFALVAEFNFPMKRILYRGTSEEFFYGSSILEAIILSGNKDVLEKLPRLLAQDGRNIVDLFEINTWTTELARAVERDPFFKPLARQFRVRRTGQEFSSELAEFGRLSPQKLNDLRKISTTKDLAALNEVLFTLFPYGSLNVKAVHPEKETDATLYWEHASLFPKDPRRERWTHIEIFDSLHFKKGITSWTNSIGKKVGFLVRSRVSDVTFLADGATNIDYNDLTGHRLNWIRSLDVKENSVSILIEKDSAGARKDSSTRFQEMEIELAKDGQIERITIRNGNNLLFRRLWSSQTVRIPNGTSSRAMHYIPGEEDLFRNQY
jgi:hypothetical protein